jgi:pyruvate formate lyase activating enzyme
MHEARLWKRLKGDTVQCRLCSHFCVIGQGERGLCGVRENREGTLMALNYGRIAALNLDPVEKKPLYHFHPGSRTYSFATAGCNLSCSFCQNWSLSQTPREGGRVTGRAMTPQELVDEALKLKAASISYTYTEPTIFFETMQDTARIAAREGLGNIMVSNGFMSRECLDEMGPLIDAANVDLKSFSEDFYRDVCGARLKPVLENLVHIRHDLGWWLEVTTLLIPGKNDSPEELDRLTDFLVKELGVDTPWHISRFHPDYRMSDVGVTGADTLEAAYAMGHSKGLRYVYVGNVPGSDRQRTLCPGCSAVLVERAGFSPALLALRGGRCEHCGTHVAGVGMG